MQLPLLPEAVSDSRLFFVDPHRCILTSLLEPSGALGAHGAVAGQNRVQGGLLLLPRRVSSESFTCSSSPGLQHMLGRQLLALLVLQVKTLGPKLN